MRKSAPDFIKDAPELWFWLVPYYEAFAQLSTCRPVDTFSGSIGRIPWTAIDRYAERYPLLNNDFEVFEFYTNALDECLLELIKNKPKPKKRDGDKEDKPDNSMG